MTDLGVLRVSDVARALEVSDTTVRTWATEYARHLSKNAAAPGPGGERVYEPRDVRILLLVKEDRRRARPTDEIHASIEAAIATNSLPMWDERTHLRDVDVDRILVARDNWLAERRELEAEAEELRRQLDRLQVQIENERADRRADIERMALAQATLAANLARAELLVELYRAGRLKPDTP